MYFETKEITKLKNTSVSRIKNFKNCPLAYLYTYVDKFAPVEKQPIWVQAKGLVLHEVFEILTIEENYIGTGEFNTFEVEKDFEEPCWWKYFGGFVRAGIAHAPVIEAAKTVQRTVTTDQILEAFEQAMRKNDFPIEKAIEFDLKKGIRRWLSFKHDFLDNRKTQLFAEKRYEEILFGETKTITILDLLEDNGDGTYTIYDYKTPKSVDVSRYKEQLCVYAYTMACVKGLITPGSRNYEAVTKHFKLKVFFPLINLKTEKYDKCLAEVPFTAEDVEDVLESIIKTCDIIDGFDFSKPAEALQKSNPNFQCKWCAFCGSEPQPETVSKDGRAFEGCPITSYLGFDRINGRFEAV